MSSRKRSALLPDVPSIVEAGYADATFRFWVGLSVPAGTLQGVIDKLHDATETALQDAMTREQLARLGVEPELMSVAQFGKFVHDDLVSTIELAKAAHIEPID